MNNTSKEPIDYVDSLLRQIGLTNRESKVYRYLLGKNEVSLAQMVKDTGIVRTSLVSVLQGLQEKRLVLEISEGANVLYRAENPSIFKSRLQDERKNLGQQLGALDSFSQRLQELKRSFSSDAISARYYDASGIRDNIDDSLSGVQDGSVFRMFYSRDLVHKYIGRYMAYRHKELQKKIDLKARAIFTCENNGAGMEGDSMERYQLSNDEYEIPAAIAVYPSSVSMITFDEGQPATLVITSPQVAETMATLFDLALHYLAMKNDPEFSDVVKKFEEDNLRKL